MSLGDTVVMLLAITAGAELGALLFMLSELGAR